MQINEFEFSINTRNLLLFLFKQFVLHRITLALHLKNSKTSGEDGKPNAPKE